jgi:hypothetical protein
VACAVIGITLSRWSHNLSHRSSISFDRIIF